MCFFLFCSKFWILNYTVLNELSLKKIKAIQNASVLHSKVGVSDHKMSKFKVYHFKKDKSIANKYDHPLL